MRIKAYDSKECVFGFTLVPSSNRIEGCSCVSVKTMGFIHPEANGVIFEDCRVSASFYSSVRGWQRGIVEAALLGITRIPAGFAQHQCRLI